MPRRYIVSEVMVVFRQLIPNLSYCDSGKSLGSSLPRSFLFHDSEPWFLLSWSKWLMNTSGCWVWIICVDWRKGVGFHVQLLLLTTHMHIFWSIFPKKDQIATNPQLGHSSHYHARQLQRENNTYRFKEGKKIKHAILFFYKQQRRTWTHTITPR